ncbi:MAG: DUF4124 domain-containing protein [Burkholderiales bacterium]
MTTRTFTVLGALLALAAQSALAQTIYSCVDAKGRKITADRPIPECQDREQRVLRRDGAQQSVVGPSMSADERAAYEEAQRRKLAEEAARKDVVRHDRNLLSRYPNATAHQRAREGALEAAEQAQKSAEKRLADLALEHKQLLAETEFYKGRELPRKLKNALGQNQASTEAQRHSIDQHEQEAARITALFDEELLRLKRLWAGAQPGSVGPIPTAATAPSAAGVSPASSSTTR